MTRKTRRTTRRSASSPATRLGTTRRCARPRARARRARARRRRGHAGEASTTRRTGRRKIFRRERKRKRTIGRAAALAREGGAGARFLEAALAASTRSRRFFACVEPAARLLAARAEAEAASAADARARGLERLERLERRLDGAPRANGDASEHPRRAENAVIPSAARGTELLPSSRALAGLVLESEKNLFASAALRGVLASALASEPLDLESLPRRPRVSESTAAPPPTPPAARSRFTPASRAARCSRGRAERPRRLSRRRRPGPSPRRSFCAPPPRGRTRGSWWRWSPCGETKTIELQNRDTISNHLGRTRATRSRRHD